MSRLLASLVSLGLLGVATTASAAPADYERGYDLELQRAAIDLHIGLAVATPRGVSAWGDNLTIELDPDGIDAIEQGDLEGTLLQDCDDVGLPAEVCEPVAAAIAESVATFNNALIDAVPVFAEFDVGSWGWVSNLFGLYPMTGSHETVDGTEAEWGYVLNDGAATFLSGGLALNGGGIQGSLACADVSGALVSGGFGGAGSKLDADFLADRELMCLGAVEGLVVAGTIGFAFGGVLDGLGQ